MTPNRLWRSKKYPKPCLMATSEISRIRSRLRIRVITLGCRIGETAKQTPHNPARRERTSTGGSYRHPLRP